MQILVILTIVGMFRLSLASMDNKNYDEGFLGVHMADRIVAAPERRLEVGFEVTGFTTVVPPKRKWRDPWRCSNCLILARAAESRLFRIALAVIDSPVGVIATQDAVLPTHKVLDDAKSKDVLLASPVVRSLRKEKQRKVSWIM